MLKQICFRKAVISLRFVLFSCFFASGRYFSPISPQARQRKYWLLKQRLLFHYFIIQCKGSLQLLLKVHCQIRDSFWHFKNTSLKLFSFSRYLNFRLEFEVMLKNGLIKKIRLNSKFMTSQPGQQTIAMHIFTNISRTKGNQIMKFGQLIEYNMRKKFFLKIIHKMRWRCYSQTPFLKYQN